MAMGIWKYLKWVAREGTGFGASQRFGRLVFRSPWCGTDRPGHGGEIWHQFMASATAAVHSFGPSWARQKVRGRPVGVWVLALAWIIPPLCLALLTFHRASHMTRRPAVLAVVKRWLGCNSPPSAHQIHILWKPWSVAKHAHSTEGYNSQDQGTRGKNPGWPGHE